MSPDINTPNAVSDAEWQALLNEYNTDFQKGMEGNRWIPPSSDQDYTCVLTEVRRVVYDEKDNTGKPTGRKCPALVPTLQIVAGDLTDRTFELGFFPASRCGMMGNVVNPSTGEALTKDNTFADFYAALLASVNQVISVSVKTTFSRKANREFTNCKIEDYPELAAKARNAGEAPLT